MNSKKGFTIVEVIVVIGIIAILTAIVVPSITDIRAKNRDSERIADIAALQLGLSLFKNQSSTGEYPASLDDLVPKYVPPDSIIPPNDYDDYYYIPLKKTGAKCIYYHLGTLLELPSAQVDQNDNFDSSNSGSDDMYNYTYCDYTGPGIDGTNPLMYDVRP